MIIDFAVENFKSIKTEQVFSMEYDEGDKETYKDNLHPFQGTQLLNLAIIYGANASGKSNFIEAFRTLRDLVFSSNGMNNLVHYYEPFAFNETTESAPTKFMLSFVVNQVKYDYSLSYNAELVLEESLFFYPNGERTQLFARRKKQFSFGEKLKGEKETVENLTNADQLFLSKGAENNMVQLKTVYTYFSDDLMVIPFLDGMADIKLSKQMAKDLHDKENSHYHLNFNSLISSLDTDINRVKVRKMGGYYEVTRKSIKTIREDYRINTIHSYKNADDTLTEKKFELARESTGTKKLFIVGGLILRALMEGRTIIIDEFERSLHHHISVFLISLFSNPQINTKGAQLIVATHDTGLIAKENHLRRDQVWFTEKSEYGETELFSLSDVKGVRKEGPFDKWYLANQLNAVPHITPLTFEENFKHE